MSTDTTPQGFTGHKHVQGRDVAETAKLIRADIKTARTDGTLTLPTTAKVSVRIDRYSMGKSIDIYVTGIAPKQLWVAPGTPPDYANNYPRHGGYAPYRQAAQAALKEIVNAYNRDNSDSMTDYYDVDFSSSRTDQGANHGYV